MREIWHFSGIPHFLEVVGKQQLVRSERFGFERNRYWLKGAYPWWGRVIQGWSGTETEVVKEWHWATTTSPDKEERSRIIK